MQFELREGVAYLTFNRPQARNALTFEMYARVTALCDAVEEDPAVRVLVLRGAGGHFAAGTDISQFSDFETGEQAIAYALEGNSASIAMTSKEQDGNSKALQNDSLSTREMEILRLMADGFSNGEIAEQLVLAKSTIKWYVRQIFSKLDVTSRTQAVARARTLGLLS